MVNRSCCSVGYELPPERLVVYYPWTNASAGFASGRNGRFKPPALIKRGDCRDCTHRMCPLRRVMTESIFAVNVLLDWRSMFTFWDRYPFHLQSGLVSSRKSQKVVLHRASTWGSDFGLVRSYRWICWSSISPPSLACFLWASIS